ncbi:MAG: hypothetical protein KDC54_03050 [Lewinella sp.]|nr:hypothetical protein [Lewinella sp.]
MTRPTILFILLIAAGMLLPGCASVDRLLETGDYEQILELAQRRLPGDARKNPKLVQAAEDAFARLNERDLRAINSLQNAPDAEANWGRVNEIYRRIRQRQAALSPLLPLVDKNGYQAYFAFIDTEAGEQESRANAAAYHYELAVELLADARRGNKKAARQAYQELEQIKRYFRQYRERDQLQNIAHDLGTVYVLVEVENDAPVITPTEFNRRLEQVNFADLNSFWRVYHLRRDPALAYDFRSVLRITDIAVGPDLVREREYTDTREIEDGFDYVLDDNGNVMKDTLGNDIKVPRYVQVKAWIFETHQQKVADVRAQLEVYSLTDNQLLTTRPLAASALFENYAATFRGDERALSRDTRRRIGNAPQPFPPAELLILQAADQLKPALFNGLNDCASIF